MARRKPAAVPPTPSPSSREELEAKRSGVVATGPSGAHYRIRPVSVSRHALAGGLPGELRELAPALASGRDPIEAGAQQLAELDEAALERMQQATRDYHDELVLALVLEPKLEKADLGTGELGEESLVPANDYDWLLAVAKGETDYDAEDRQLWGLEPLSRFRTFREEHGCPPDCPRCARVRERVSAAYR